MADDEGDPAPEQGIDQRVASLEAGQSSLSEKLDKILGIVGAGGHDDDPSGQPAGSPTVAEEIRRQLEERDARDRENTDRQSLKDGLAQVQAQLAEKPPAPMPRRVEKIMGWT